MNDDLPVKTTDNFLAEAEIMDLSAIKNKMFMVGISNGSPDGYSYLCSSIHGPYTFVEMLQEVGEMWVNHQHHAKVLIPSKDPTKAVELLDANTVDYIELNYTDLITEEMLDGMFDQPKNFTCRVGIISDIESDDPRVKKDDSASLPDSLS